MSAPIIRVSNLAVDFASKGIVVNTPLRGVSFEVESGKTLGIVGETGCGKTLTGLSILNLLPPNAIRRGEIWLDGHGELNSQNMADVRGVQISFIFQNPHSAFNPVFTIEKQLKIVAHRQGLDHHQGERIIRDRLKEVGLDDIDRVLTSFPHQLSGGMLQRCMIAMALLGTPKLLIADEPTTALDSTIARQILTLIYNLQKQYGFALILISHDVGLVSDIADNIAVLYAGRVVETGTTNLVLSDPKHPYTKGLLQAIPSASVVRGGLTAIPGQVPANTLTIVGCSFASRCSQVQASCANDPALKEIAGRNVACGVVTR
ncbi:MAG: ABC transporter ATP-binding protein [Actinomycetes bacterium]